MSKPGGIRGIRQPIKPGIIGRIGKGVGAPEVLSNAQITQMLKANFVKTGGTIQFANPTATAGPAAVNGTSSKAMRSDAAPAIQKGSSSLFGIVKVDNATIVASGGVISAVPSGAGASTEYKTIPELGVHANVESFSAGFFGARPLVMDYAGTINSLKIGIASAAATAKIIPGVYADSSGSMGALLSQGPQVTGLTVGINKFPVSTPVSFVKGDILWIGMQVTVAAMSPWDTVGRGTAFFASTGALPNPPTGVTYADHRWGSMWASSDT